MEEEVVWEIGEIGGGESPPLFDEASPPLFDEAEATPPLFDRTMPLPPIYLPASGSSLTRDHAAAGGASISNKRGRVAASSKAIQGLREVTAPPPTDGADDCCAICLQDLDFHPDPPAKTGDLRLRAMPCSHTFHEHCIFQWLRRNAVFPLCRHQLPTEDDHEQLPTVDDHEQEQEQGRRSLTRVAYNEEDGQYYMTWDYRDLALAVTDSEEPELNPEHERLRGEGWRPC